MVFKNVFYNIKRCFTFFKDINDSVPRKNDYDNCEFSFQLQTYDNSEATFTENKGVAEKVIFLKHLMYGTHKCIFKNKRNEYFACYLFLLKA